MLEGEADQAPDVVPGNIVFVLSETEHPLFKRQGADLLAHIEITLAEALCGFSRVVLKHLDGRGIHINHPPGSILKPKQFIKISGEGMPIKRSEMMGDLYCIVDVKFPDESWIQDENMRAQLQRLLPPPDAPIKAETVDEVEHDDSADMNHFGRSERGADGAWVDDEEEGRGQPQCAQQ